MKTQIGLELCISGMAEVLTVSGKQTLTPGTLMIHSPVFPMLEVFQSEDYASVSIKDNIDQILPFMSANPLDVKNLSALKPFLQLDPVQQEAFIRSVEAIRASEARLKDLKVPFQHNLMENIISLSRKKLLLEHAFLFTGQLLGSSGDVSRHRVVFINFLLTLNREFTAHRSVAYYSDKQGVSQRYFSAIIKRESGYTPMEWINMITINQAKALLRKPNMLVKQVASELGFPEQFTFRKYFHAHAGMSPKQYQHSLK